MPLKTFVKVGSITNLSDARYCAGMGVDLLGFCALEGQANYISPKQFQEIRGWVSGPKVVAEISGLNHAAALSAIIENYRPDFLELGVAELPAVGKLSIPLILRGTASELQQLTTEQKNIAFMLIQEHDKVELLPDGIPVLLELTSLSNLEVLHHHPSFGIALSGSSEISPGLKNYDHLAEVLEQLEIQD
ncbi:MAG: phosphoribosylanthranilate isomerase [Cyclobacteriaceae bacterium]|nr:phosphoribosylanthranilate isomerase [Cyclobacteriaceae bacterium]